MAASGEGRIRIDDAGHEIQYWTYGDGPVKLVGLHGGPGMTHRYLQRLSSLGGDDLTVVLYDQLGSGRSDRPDDPSLWTMERFVAEVEAVRAGLDLGRIHLLGQSWGGWLGLQYALDHGEHVESLLLSNTSANIPLTFKEMVRLRTQLDPGLFATLTRYEASGDLDADEYVDAVHHLYARHLRRATPFEIETSLRELREEILPLLDDVGPAYEAMWGPHEFLCNGSLLDWDVTDRLHELRMPCLILCGYYDELTVDVHREMADRIPRNEFVIFGHSSHLTILENESAAYLAVVKDFVLRNRA